MNPSRKKIVLSILSAFLGSIIVSMAANAQVASPNFWKNVGNDLYPVTASSTMIGSSTYSGAFNNLTISGNCTGCGSGASSTYSRAATKVVCASNAVDTTNCDYKASATSSNLAIQSAINALTNGGQVVLGDGLFIVSSTIVINSSGTTLTGQGGGGTILKARAHLDASVIKTASTTQNVTIQDIKCDGNASQNSSTVCIEGTDLRNSVIQNNWITNANNEGVYLNGDANLGWYNVVANNDIDHNGIGTHARFDEYTYFTNNAYSFNSTYAAESESDNDQYQGNSFDVTTGLAELYLPFGAGIYKVFNNTFTRFSQYGLLMRQISNSQIVGNTFDSVPTNFSAIQNGQFAAEAGSGNIFADNNITGSQAATSTGIGESSSSTNNVYQGNILSKVTTPISLNASSTNYVINDNRALQLFALGSSGNPCLTVSTVGAVSTTSCASASTTNIFGSAGVSVAQVGVNATASLNLAYSPTWTGNHTWSYPSGTVVVSNGTNLLSITPTSPFPSSFSTGGAANCNNGVLNPAECYVGYTNVGSTSTAPLMSLWADNPLFAHEVLKLTGDASGTTNLAVICNSLSNKGCFKGTLNASGTDNSGAAFLSIDLPDVNHGGGIFMTDSNNWNDGYWLKIRNGTNTPEFYVGPAGDTGIGTETPNARLEIKANSVSSTAPDFLDITSSTPGDILKVSSTTFTGGYGNVTGTIPRVLFVKALDPTGLAIASDTITTAVASNTEVAYATNYTIPANYFKSGKTLHVTAGVQFTLPGTGTNYTFRLELRKAGSATSTLFASVTNIPIPVALTRGTGFDFYVTALTAPSANASMTAMSVAPPINSAAEMGFNTQTVPVAVDTTSQLILQFSALWANNTNPATSSLIFAKVEEVN
jgi:hypothetical protein